MTTTITSTDGLHPTAASNALIATAFYNTITTLLA
jgi:hypothetical protein